MCLVFPVGWGREDFQLKTVMWVGSDRNLYTSGREWMEILQWLVGVGLNKQLCENLHFKT